MSFSETLAEVADSFVFTFITSPGAGVNVASVEAPFKTVTAS